MANLGYKVKWGQHAWDVWGYFAGTDADRAADINAMFADPEVKAIVACRGGWGDARIISLLDYESIRVHPKALVGFSDLTATLNALFTKTGLIAFHGPMGIDDFTDSNANYFTKVLGGQIVDFVTNPKNISTIRGGKARGRLLGGNLSVFVAVIGSEFLLTPKQFDEPIILFLEDVGEYSYSLDRMLTHLKLAGYLDSVAGVVWGTCSSCKPQYPNDFSVNEILHQHFGALSVPVFTGAMFGHIDQMFTLPIGVKVEIDANAGTISMLESATL